MSERRKKKSGGLSSGIFGLFLFALSLPFFLKAGGGRFLLSEALPGQAVFIQAAEEKDVPAALVGKEDISFEKTASGGRKGLVSGEMLEKLSDFSYLRSNYYTVDSRTELYPEDIPVKEMYAKDLTVERTMKEPKILIFHTHAHEGFADSDMSKGMQEGVWGAAEYLKEILEKKYGIAVLHDCGKYDEVNGVGKIVGSYERMEAPIRKVLKENPSVEVVIDMHRDGVPEDTRLIREVGGKTCAKLMFFNGLCRLKKDGGTTPISGLENPYVSDNLAMSLQMKLNGEAMFPGLCRKVYVNAYRFSLHMMPRSTLVEVGAQNNTKEEAWNAMEPLADILASVLLREE